MFLKRDLAVLMLFCAGTAVAQPESKKPQPGKLVTQTYDLKRILGDRGKASGFADMDGIIKVLFESLPALRELKPGDEGPQLIERNGGKLEIRATAEVHREVKDLIEALERLTDLAIDLEVEVIELDIATFEKLAKALPKPAKGKPNSPVLFATGEEFEEKGRAVDAKALAEMNRVLKIGRVVQTSTARFANGVEANLSARQSVLSYKSRPESLVVKEGFRLAGTPVVSGDRRFVRFKLTEKSVAVTGMRKRDLGEIGGRKIVAETPELEDLGATGSAVVADGGTILFRLAYAPKNQVWVVALRPTIFIQAEEDALKEKGK